jgi:hypothetical protein
MPLTSLLILETLAREEPAADLNGARPLTDGAAKDDSARRRLSIRPPAEVRRAPCPPVLSAVLTMARTPNARHRFRRERVPSGTKQLFRISAGRTDVINDAIRFTGKDPHFLQAACIFYIEEILWHRDADPYRVLGLNSDAPFEVVSAHVDVILDWLTGPNDRHARDRIRYAWQSIDSASSSSRGPTGRT